MHRKLEIKLEDKNADKTIEFLTHTFLNFIGDNKNVKYTLTKNGAHLVVEFEDKNPHKNMAQRYYEFMGEKDRKKREVNIINFNRYVREYPL